MRQGLVFDLFYWITDGGISNEELVISLFTTAVLLFVLTPVHEYAHAAAAKFLGDDTAERHGRLTLNPFAHFDFIGTSLILLFRIGWAKPVPVNPVRCRKVSARVAMVITAIAGPLSNIIMSYIFLIISKLIIAVGDITAATIPVSWAFYFVAVRSIYLAVFNLIPVPPLDGSYVLLYFLPRKWNFKIMQYQNIIMMAFFMLLFATPVFGYVIVPASNAMMNILDWLSGFAGKSLW
jgi:Zn-dependent protease